MADPTEAAQAENEDEAPKKNWRRDLEDRLAKAEDRASQAERRAAIAESGLTGLNAKQRKALEAAHEGEWTNEALKATAAELGFGKPAPVSEESTSEPTTPESDHSTEAQELAALSDSPASHSESSNASMTQAAFDEKVRSFDNPDELEAFLRENLHRLQYG